MTVYYTSKGSHSPLSQAYSSLREAEEAAEKLCSLHGSDVYVYKAITRFIPGVRPTTKQVLDE